MDSEIHFKFDNLIINNFSTLFDFLSEICDIHSEIIHGKMKEGYIIIYKINNKFHISYTLVRPFFLPLGIYCLVEDFLLQQSRIKICNFFFSEKTNQNFIGSYSLPAKFDDKQKEVICIDKGYHLVLAPAGCGKTDILAERVRRAILSGIDVEDMLCLTFTNRASRGMRNRIKQYIGNKANDLFIGNTHRFCSKFLYENNIISQSTAILDEVDTFSIISDFIHRELDNNKDNDKKNQEIKPFQENDEKYRTFINAVINIQHLMDQYRRGHDKSIFLKHIGEYRINNRSTILYSPNMFESLCKVNNLSVSINSILEIYDNSEKYLRSALCLKRELFICDLMRLLDIAKKYEMYKKDENLIDFDDLLIMTYDYARNNPTIIHKYTWIQIDEVQDLNPLQFAIVDMFTRHDNVTIYLGDEQQAIFSFMGAKIETLDWLKQRCSRNLHHLNKCYRSPKYLLDIFNDYAYSILHTDKDFLPVPNNFDEPKEDDLVVFYAMNNASVVTQSANIALKYKDGRTAILVPSNNDADAISSKLGETPHFKISGTDLFSLKETKLILSHLNVVNLEINFLAWARILYTLGLSPSYALAQKLVSDLKRIGINPSDFILYQRSSYLLEFLKHYDGGTIVVFDTETTGLDIFSDDIVQIAAIKYFQGIPIDSINIILHTDKEIPSHLGKIPNPLVEEYKIKPHINRKDGLQKFFDFAKDCVLIGHNVDYDYNILINNCKRDLPNVNVYKEFPIVFDTLKLTRLICPNLRSYKLKDLLVTLQLEGKNSHLANEDIIATYSIVKYCYDRALLLKKEIEKTIYSLSDFAELLRDAYGSLYVEAKKNLYTQKDNREESALTLECRKAYNYFIRKGSISEIEKFSYICDFFNKEVIDQNLEKSLYQQLSNHIMDINTFKEADICDSSIVKENIFVATVHKAKGLEFENVIVYGCVNGTYPFFASTNPQEDARKLYVAMTRAKNKLCLMTYRNKYVYSKKYNNTFIFDAEISPFLEEIVQKHSFNYIFEN